jgi:hypothetical protein
MATPKVATPKATAPKVAGRSKSRSHLNRHLRYSVNDRLR